MMRLLLDMGLSPRVAEHLRQAGHDALHLRERGLQRLPDAEIVRLAEAEGRVVVTLDLDFARILALQRLARPSVILFRLERFTTAEINERLSRLLRDLERELQDGAIVVVDPERARVRSLPIWP